MGESIFPAFNVGRPLPAGTSVPLSADRDLRQKQLMDWCHRAFDTDGGDAGLQERARRFLEEAVELFQAVGGDVDSAHFVTDYVFHRSVGEAPQEIGGVMVTLMLLAEAQGLSVEDAETTEMKRILSLPDDHFRKRQAEKRAAGL